jgi:O-methyltransferase
VELGVYKGGSALVIAEAMKDSGKTLHLFDTFEGLKGADPKHDQHTDGEFSASMEEVRAILPLEPTIELHRGTLPNSLGSFFKEVAFVHFDLDLYAPTLSALFSMYPRMERGGVMVFDDYTMPDCLGVKKAINEFFEGRVEAVLPLSTGQAVVVKA